MNALPTLRLRRVWIVEIRDGECGGRFVVLMQDDQLDWVADEDSRDNVGRGGAGSRWCDGRTVDLSLLDSD
jgi:hypothetical protein